LIHQLELAGPESDILQASQVILVLVVLGPQFGNSVQGPLHETGTEAQ